MKYLYQLVQMRNSVQRERIRFSNRLSAIERGVDIPAEGEASLYQTYFERFQELEDQANKDIEKEIKNHPMYDSLTGVKGIGSMLAAQILSQIDIERADTVSALWRYAGYAVIDGEAERKRKGQKNHYNYRLKQTMYVAASSFLKSNSPYRRFYDDAKEYYTANRPDWTKMHIHYASLRKMIKMFLSHLWHVWRKMEGLETRELYVVEKLGHDNIVPPDNFGWYD